jgi:hypothetical protein
MKVRRGRTDDAAVPSRREDEEKREKEYAGDKGEKDKDVLFPSKSEAAPFLTLSSCYT